MELSIRRYNFTNSPLFLGIYFIFLISVTFYIGKPSFNDQWISALFSFRGNSPISLNLQIFILLLLYLSTVYLLHNINSKILTIGKEKLFLPLIYLIFTFSSPSSVNLSGAVPAAFLIILSVYYTILSHKDEKFIFVSGLLISLAVIFEPRFFLLIILPVIFVFSGRTLNFRELVILLISIILPFIVLSSVYQQLTGNLSGLINAFIVRITSTEGSVIIKDTTVGYALLFVSVILVSIALKDLLSRINRVKIIKAMALYRHIALLLGLLVIYFIYPSLSESILPVIALPISVIVSESISSRESSSSGRIMFFVFLILLTIKKIYYFI